MNPSVATQPRRFVPIADVARPLVRPVPAPTPATATTPVAPAPSIVPSHLPPSPQAKTARAEGSEAMTSIVGNIPMHAPSPAPVTAPAASEDDELEVIMKDIGQELKQADRKITKKHISLFGRKHQATATKPLPVPIQAAPAAPKTQPATQSAAAPQPAAKPLKSNHTPVGAIFVTVLVTGVLIAAAIYSYK